jgi:hypothetical protein
VQPTILGGVAEWLKAADLKSVDVKASVGSNPTSSAIYGDMAEWLKAALC